LAYYDRIADKWHAVTGFHGGAFKRYVLNDRLLERVGRVEGLRILELGAGNGYFMAWMLRRFSGQTPERVVVTDHCEALLELAERYFRVEGAEYCRLDVRSRFPFPDESFDLILATMVFNEMSTAGLKRALAQCGRVLADGGRLIATVTHPRFIDGLSQRRELRRARGGLLTMPGSKGLRLPIFPRTVEQYERILSKAGFRGAREDLFATENVLREKPGLRRAGSVTVALVIDCRPKRTDEQ
jgi:ubiquinone/menaquinone biosynthesis C-methylase UbiE